MSDKVLGSPDLFESIAFGILNNSVDTDEGRAALVDAYNKYDWTDNDKVLSTLETYGHRLKQKNKDMTELGEEVEDLVPIPLSAFTGVSEGTDPTEVYNRWEQVNATAIKESKNPAYISMRTQLLHDLNSYASEKRRGLYEERAADSPVGSSVSEVGTFFARGAASGIEGVLNKTIGGDFELNSNLTERTSTSRERNIGYQLVEGLGNAAGAIGAGLVAGPLGSLGFMAGQAIDAVGTRYDDTMYSRGNENGEATTAATIEGGSQLLQTAAGLKVFGGIVAKQAGKVVKDTLGKQVGKSMATEGLTEGVGQHISSFAQDIEKNTEDGSFIDRLFQGERLANSAQAGVVGAAVAGVAEVASNKTLPTKKLPVGEKTPNDLNTNDRSNELSKYGAPVTPVDIQMVGDIVSPKDPVLKEKEEEDVIPGEFDFVDSETGKPVEEAPLTPDTERKKTSFVPDFSTVQAPRTPAFVVEDGSTWGKTNDTQYAEQGTPQHDATIVVDEETDKKLQDVIENRTGTVTFSNGTVLIEKKGEEPEIAAYSTAPVKDGFVWNMSNPRMPNRDTVQRPIKRGGRILEIIPGGADSMGAAREIDDVLIKESALGQHLRTDPRVPSSLQAIGEKGIGYQVQSNIETFKRLASELEDTGLEAQIGRLTSLQAETPQDIKTGVAAAIYNDIQNKILIAQTEGDFTAAEKYEQALQLVSDVGGTDAGRGLEMAKRKVGFGDVTKNIQEKTREKITKSKKKIAVEEDVSEEVVEKSEQLLDGVNKAIEQEKENVEYESTKEVVPKELQDINTVIEEVETPAREKLDTDLESIALEEEALTEEVATIEKKAIRSKRKAEATVAQDIAEASQELTGALRDAASLKEATAEETATLNAEIDKALEAAIGKVSTEVTKVVKEERAARELDARTKIEKATDKITKIEQLLNSRKANAAERLKKLLVKKSNAEAVGKPVADISEQITTLENSITNIAQRLVDAKENLRTVEREVSAEEGANREAEEVLKALEEGVEVKIVPTKKGRVSVIQTKKSKLNISKLFKNKDSAAHGPLLTLSNAVNDLAGTVKQSLGARVINNERIAELNKRIKEGKSLLDESRKNDALSPREKQKIANAKKRLAELNKAKEEATLESRIPKNKQETYKKFKARKEQIDREPKQENPAAKAAKDRLKKLEKDREKLTKINDKKKTAEKEASEEMKMSSADVEEIKKIDKALNTVADMTPSKRAELENRKIIIRAKYEKNPDKRYPYFSMWAANVINGPVTGTLSLQSGAIAGVAYPAVYTVLDIAGLAKDAATLNIGSRKLTGASFVKGFFGARTREIAYLRAEIALTTGERVRTDFTKEDLTFKPDINTEVYSKDGLQLIGDFWKYTQQLDAKNAKDTWDKIKIRWFQASGWGSFIGMRYLAAAEALVSTMVQGGFDGAVSAQTYNDAQRAMGKVDAITQAVYQARTDWETAQLDADKAERILKKAVKSKVPADELAQYKRDADATKEAVTATEKTLVDATRAALDRTEAVKKAFDKASNKVVALEARYEDASEANKDSLREALNDARAEEAAAKTEYDTAIGADNTLSKLIQYKYDPDYNWDVAREGAAKRTKELKDLGIDVSPHEETISAIEQYNTSLPREVQLTAFKQATQIVGNGPAQGLLGLISGSVNNMIVKIGGDRGPLTFLMPFLNSTAHFANGMLAWTPYGFVDAQFGRTEYEKSFIRAQALTGTVTSIALIGALKSMLEKRKEGEELPLDFISTDGGYTYDIQVFGVRIKTKDTPLAIWAMGVGKAFDAVKDGRLPDPVLTTATLVGAFTIAMEAEFKGSRNAMSLLKGPASLLEVALKGIDDPDARVQLVHTLGRTAKGFIPGAHMVAMAARFMHSPVVGKSDLKSAIVEGIPVLQGIFGETDLNAFGEDMPPGYKGPDFSLYRVFSMKPSDVDFRWLSDNGYEIPQLRDMTFDKKHKEAAKENNGEKYFALDNRMRRTIYKRASTELREVVSNFRQQYGSSAYDPEIQKALRKSFNDVLNFYEAEVVNEALD
jgi:hypothetical protein